jgi:hypothetical protein
MVCCRKESVMTWLMPFLTLRRALWADAFVSSGLGVLQLAGGAALAARLGLPQPLVWATGLFMLVYVATLLWLARRKPIASWCVAVIVYGNTVWAAACVAIWASGEVLPTALGIAYLLLQALAVFALAAWQFVGWRASPPVDLHRAALSSVAQ